MMKDFSSNLVTTHKAWVVHAWCVGETSLQVVLLTRDAGLCSVRYAGGRGKRAHGVVQPFKPLSLVLSGRYIRGLEANGTALLLERMSLYAAMYVNELIYRLIKPKQIHPMLFDAYEYVMFGLSKTDVPVVIAALLRQFEWQLLKACGYGLHFASSTLADCYQFIPEKGFVPTKTNGLTHAIAVQIIQGCFDTLPVLQWAKPVLRAALDHALDGKPLLSRQLVASVTLAQNLHK